MTPVLQKVIKLLGRLDPAELTTIGKHVKALGGAFGKPVLTGPDDTDVQLVLDAICEITRGLGVEFASPATLKAAKVYPSFAAKVPALMQYVRQGAKRRTQQRALLTVGITLLYDNCRDRGLPVQARYLMASIHRVPSVLNQAFPGYAESGLLGLILRETPHVRQKRCRKPRPT